MDEKTKILIVEDERVIAMETRYKLESMGYDVPAIAASGKEAIRKAQELSPDLILMDIILQGDMDGVEAADQIHTRFDIPVVYVTANVSDARLEDIARSEPFGCLFKPFEDMELQAAVKMALYKHKMEKKLRESEENYRSIVANSHDGILIVGEDYRFAYVNDMFCRIVGYSRSEIIGQDFRKFIDEKGKKLVADRFKLRQAEEKPPPRYEFNVVRKDGIKRRVEISSTVSKDSKGRVRTIAQILDITEQKQAERELRDSEKKYRTLAETTNDITFVLDLEGKFTYVSPAAEKLIGYPWQELIERSFTEIISPEYVKSTVERFKKGLAGGEIPLYEIEMKHKNGGTVPIELNVTLLLDATGKTAGRIGVARDITERKQAEEALRKSEEKYRLIAENMHDMIRLVDTQGTNLYSSPSHKAVLGYSPEERVGKSSFEVVHPDDMEKVQKIFAEAFVESKLARVEYRTRHADGHYIWLETIGNFIYDDSGQTTGAVLSSRDITKRKEMERELEGRFQYLEGILEAAPYAIIALDRFHHVLRWNPGAEKLFGYSQEEVIGRELDPLVATTSDAMEGAKRATKKVMDGKALSPWETVRFRKDGSPVDVIASGSAIMVNGELIGVVAIYVDITDRKLAEQEIKSHQEHLTLINQILRHDLTNDLVVIQSALNLYNKSPEEGLLKEISSHARKSLELIKRMRGLESFMSSRKNLKPSDIREAVDGVIKSYPSIDFEIKGKAHVMADDSLVSVIDNIIRNAVIHGKADRITITTGRERDMCELHIADNGTGIPDDIKEKIFEEGFMYGDTGHTGLGLHIVKKAMESYGGYAWAEDNEPKGAVIVLRFRMVK